MEKKSIKIGCIGLGNMGGAIAGGLAAQGYENIFGYHPDPARCDERCKELYIQVAADLEEVCQNDIVLLAVKPYQLEDVLRQLIPFLGERNCLVSVAAGVSLALLTDWSAQKSPVVRVMPNTPALVRRGAFALAYGSPAPDANSQKAIEEMFSCIGQVYLLDEKHFDTFGALIGAGPAYVFAFMEALIDAGVDQGLPRAQASAMVSDLLDGSVALQRATKQHVTLLKEMVTSPGGVTIAGLNQFDKHSFRHAVIEAVDAAVRRSKELV